MADAIFISYRRDDSEGEAGRLFDDLTRAFGTDAVFMDVAGIKPGVDFRKAIEDNVANCGVLLAVIGPTWATITNADGHPRLEDPNDFVALEISSALKREVPVIPVLVHDAKMPAADLLPESLKSFAYHNSVEISHARWGSDVALLVDALGAYVTPSSNQSSPEAPLHATVPVQLPAPHPPKGAAVQEVTKSWRPMLIGALAGGALILAVVAYFVFGSSANSNKGTSAATVAGSAASPNPSIAAGAVAPFTEYEGTWRRIDGPGDSDALGEVIVSGTSANVTVHAFGRCQGPACDWGNQRGIFYGADLVATFAPPPNNSDTSRTAMVRMHPAPGGLDVLIHNVYQNPAGPHANNSHHVFTATP